MKPLDTRAEAAFALQQADDQEQAGFVRVPGIASPAYRWPQVQPMPRPVIRHACGGQQRQQGAAQ